MQDLKNESAKAGEENKQLSEDLDFLEDVMICTNCSGNLRNHGRPIHEVGHQKTCRSPNELHRGASSANQKEGSI